MKILVVEDEPNNMMLMTYLLKKYGHETVEAFTGEEGILKAAAVRPDLILMDIKLPGIDGFETAGRIRKMKNMADVPIIAVTSYAIADDFERIKKAGCNGCIEKPFDSSTIMDNIMEMIKAIK